jgi:hypothetical protein
LPHFNHHIDLEVGARSPREILVAVEISSNEVTWCSALRKVLPTAAPVQPMLSNASIVDHAFTHVQRRVRCVKFVVKFGVIVVAVIMPVISEGGRGQALRATS